MTFQKPGEWKLPRHTWWGKSILFWTKLLKSGQKMYDPHVLLPVNNTAESTNLFFLDRLFSYVATQTVVAIHSSTCTVNSTTANPQAPQVWHAFSLGGQHYQHLSIATLGHSWHQVFMEALGKKKVQKLSAPLPLGTKISGQIFKSAQECSKLHQQLGNLRISKVVPSALQH